MRIFQGTIIIKSEKDELIGICTGTKEELKNIWVDKDHRGRGIGTELINEYHKYANKDYLTLVNVDNFGARRFYERHGLRLIGFGTDKIKEFWVMSRFNRKGGMRLEADLK